MRIQSLAAALGLVLVAGCSSTSEEPAPVTTADTGSTAADAPDTIDAATEDTSTSSDVAPETPATPPAAPSMVSVVKMAGNLHVTWKLNDTGLTNVELWRKKDAGEYAKVLTLPGKATNQHDTGAVAPGEYCYKVKTLRAGLESEFSGEMCGTP